MPTAGQLFRLSRVLRDVALAATSDPELPVVPLGLVLITDDIAAHTDTTVGEIAARTGLAQSLVSRTIAELRDAGVVETRADDADRRRTRVGITEAARSEIFAARGQRSITAALSAHLPGLSAHRISAVEAKLDQVIAAMDLSADAGRGSVSDEG